MVKLLCCNTRGLNGLNKKKEVKLLCISLGVGLICFLEMRIKENKVDNIDDNMFGGWSYYSNHGHH